jgi:hypothetical protein
MTCTCTATECRQSLLFACCFCCCAEWRLHVQQCTAPSSAAAPIHEALTRCCCCICCLFLANAQDDVLLRVTNTAICGSDLHLYLHGMPGMKSGDVLGHEFMGVVEEVGENVTNIKR